MILVWKLPFPLGTLPLPKEVRICVESRKGDKLTRGSQAPKCVLMVTGRAPRQFASWYRIWEVAVAINAMCISQGKGGFWERVGKSRPVVRKLAEFPWLICCQDSPEPLL